ncbi:MAG TPA: hypothetical protein VFZ42_02630 [Chitinophagaceae bacterium]
MTNKFIIESFWQKADNCTSIVLIKAAILTYGIGKVFKVTNKSGYRLISLKDRRMLLLTNTEIRKINKANKILFSRPHDPIKKKRVKQLRQYVELCFAVIVRNLQLHGYKGKEFTLSSAIHHLTKEGMHTDHIHQLLGLRRKRSAAHSLSDNHLRLFKMKKAVLLYSDEHITIASRGYYEDFGTAVPIADTIPLLKGKKAKEWFELK